LCAGAGDVYCYACDDSKVDPHLRQHLGTPFSLSIQIVVLLVF
jgi:hypothetical protein